MKISDSTLISPIYLKLGPDMPWPERESMFYLLASNGLFVCRNHPFYRSSVPADVWPCELAEHKPFLKLSYPKIRRRLFEQVVGFFAVVGDRHSAEAAALLVWNRSTQEVEVLVPDQRSIVSRSSFGRPWPIEVRYQIPPLAPHQTLIGDIHSHVDGAAYASAMDRNDEVYRPGLHVVVGRIFDEPPQFHIEATADGSRFEVKDLSVVTEGYEKRRTDEFPRDWLDRVQIEEWRSDSFSDKPRPMNSGRSLIGGAPGHTSYEATWEKEP